MAVRPRVSGGWVVWSLLTAWLAGVLYLGLLAAHWLLGVPWHPWLGRAGAALFVLAVCGFSAFLVGCGIYQSRQAPGGGRPEDPGPPGPQSGGESPGDGAAGR